MAWTFILYLLYGLAFFTLGVAILSRDIRLSELGIARIIWLLAVFGIVHGFHEWLELLEQLNPSDDHLFSTLRLLIVTISFLFLLYFGVFLNIIALYGDQALTKTPPVIKTVVAVIALVLVSLAVFQDYGSGGDTAVRRLIALPGGLLSGVGLILYSRTVRPFSRRVAANFILAGICMCAYSLFTGIVPSTFALPYLGVTIIPFRGLSAFFIMFFTIRALSVFSIEQRSLINERLLRFSQSEKLSSMGILAAGIAHEINNPLTNALLNLEMLKDLVPGTEQIDRKLSSIERNIARASKIAVELLTFSRQNDSAFEPVNLNEVIKSAVHLLRHQDRSSIIALNLQEIPAVMGVFHKLEEVLINVLMNSFDSCVAEDSIDVETYADDEHVIVMISDTGHGIDAGKISQIFDPFFTTKEIGKGTGLGLSVSYNIIKQHNGAISMISSQGGGAIVTIKIPRADRHA